MAFTFTSRIRTRPITWMSGIFLLAFAVSMWAMMFVDYVMGSSNFDGFFLGGLVTMLFGAVAFWGTKDIDVPEMSLRQIFLFTVLIWLILPIFGGLPFMFGAPYVGFIDAYFEAMSALTTTGATVFVGLDDMPPSVLFWRSLMHWYGGIGIIVVALSIFPAMGIGGMQFFRSEGFETFGKMLPKAQSLAVEIIRIYLLLTFLCFLAYLAVGMPGFDAFNMAMSTLATGGMAVKDASFGAYKGPAEYVATVFMLLAALPFVLYIAALKGRWAPLFSDVQVRGFLWIFTIAVLAIITYKSLFGYEQFEVNLRESLFNVASILSGTGFASDDYQYWGAFPVAIFFVIGMIGGCTGSTACSIKVFRYQVFWQSLRVKILQLHQPHGVFPLRYAGQKLEASVVESVAAFFLLYLIALVVTTTLILMTGLDPVTAITGSISALCNIGPGLGEVIGPAGNFQSINDPAKVIFALAMLVGRLEFVSFLLIFTVNFWRN